MSVHVSPRKDLLRLEMSVGPLGGNHRKQKANDKTFGTVGVGKGAESNHIMSKWLCHSCALV